MKSNNPNNAVNWTQRFKIAVLTLFISSTLALAMPAAGQGPIVKRGVDAMTMNLYIGGGLENILGLDPTDPNYLNELVGAVTGLYVEIVASQPNVRIAGVADKIVERMPDLVSIQEATLVRVQSPGDFLLGGTTPATTVVFDYVQMLVAALEQRGAHYAVASVSEELDIELPMFNAQTRGFDDVRQTDREAILVRTDLPGTQFRVSNPQDGNFKTHLIIPGVGLSVPRGWCSVDVFAGGKNFRYICTHLEQETTPLIQLAQAEELLCGPAKVALPVMLAGDFNADPFRRDGSFAYPSFILAGFRDAWAITHLLNLKGGLTWGHDELLADPTVRFDRRIDLIFYRGDIFAPIGADVADLSLGRTFPPLWASDHAAVLARFWIR